MAVSVFDLFTIGIGPSSSHTVGPMRAARQFVLALHTAGCLARVTRVRVHLYGSLAATGRGHGSHKALMLGLEGETAEATDIDRLPARIAAITAARRLTLLGQHAIPFDPAADLIFEHRERLPGHPNGMRFIALADDSSVNLTSADDDEGEWSSGSGCGHGVPHGERSGSEQSMMNRPQPVPPDSKQILHDSVDMQETLSMVS